MNGQINKWNKTWKKITTGFQNKLLCRQPGIDGILVTVGLCIIALLLCVVMKDSLSAFIKSIVTALQNEATKILGGA